MAVVRILPPFVLTDDDVGEFADALRETVKRARRMPSSLAKFALSAAGIR
jgi:acetylornithine/succinyldiaminopimelate/putrescine aminotransferase